MQCSGIQGINDQLTRGIHLTLVSICAIDPAVKPIWCSGMAGIYA